MSRMDCFEAGGISPCKGVKGVLTRGALLLFMEKEIVIERNFQGMDVIGYLTAVCLMTRQQYQIADIIADFNNEWADSYKPDDA